MDIYDHPTFQMACQQFDLVADHLDIPANERGRLKYPKRSMTVALPVRRDDGTTQVFAGYRVQHHLTLGPTKGGLRYHPDVRLGEVAALAMWMSWKCALTGLPYGGAKGGVACDPGRLSIGELERLTRRYTQEMIPFIGEKVDVMAPDMGTNEQTMAWMMDTYSTHAGYAVPGIVTGKPVSIGGSLGRRESTGRGAGYLINRAMDMLGLAPGDCRAVVQGFGNVGSVAAFSMAKYGVKVTGVSDASGGLHNPKGIDLWALEKHVARERTVAGFPGAEAVTNEQLLVLPCEILVPAAVERQITGANAGKIQCRILAEAANGPVTPEADVILDTKAGGVRDPGHPVQRGRRGGVVLRVGAGFAEFFLDGDGGDGQAVPDFGRGLHAGDGFSRKQKTSMRMAALSLGIKRVQEAKRIRGLFP